MNFKRSGVYRQSIKVILALVLIASLAVPMVLGVALAQSPAECVRNCAYADIGKDKLAVHQGETIHYDTLVGNPRIGCEDGCDFMDVDVALTLPAADGTASGEVRTLDTGASFTAVPPSETTYTPEAYIVAVNEDINGGVHEVQTITAEISAHGTLMDVPGGTECTTVGKPLGVTVLWPDVEVTKDPDTDLSKPGDTICYTIRVTNTGEEMLYKDTIIDTLLGDITADFAETLDPGLSDTGNSPYCYTVLPGDLNPLVNEVEVIYHDWTLEAGVSTAEFAQVSDTASAEVDLVHPDLLITKSGDEQSKPGDVVTYEFYIHNTGDCTLDRQSVNDTLLGDITADFPATLGPGDSATVTETREVLPGDLNPLVNTVTAIYVVPELGNEIERTADHSVDLVAPDLLITKSGDTLSKPGDVVTYEFYIENTGDCTLNRQSVTDTLLGDITADFPATLGPGDSTTVTKTREVLPGDPNPLENCVTAIYVVPELGNEIERTDCHSVDLIHADLLITKSGDELSKPGDVVTYEFYIENTGDCTLSRQSVTDTVLGNITANFPATLGPGDSAFVTKSRTVEDDDPDPLVNTVTAIYVVPELGNEVTAHAGPHSVDLVHPDLAIEKEADPTVAEVGDTITYTIVLTNPSDDCPLNRVSVNDTLLGDITADFPATLGPHDSVTVTKTRDIQPGDSFPLRNTVTAIYEVPELGNRITATDWAEVNVPGVPTLTQWGIIGMAALFLAALVVFGVRRRRRISSTTH